MRIVVTAGPTWEWMDRVRYISNPSSGKMGFAVAEAAAARGHRVTLITGPVALASPRRVKTVRVVTTEQMRRATVAAFRRADAAVMTAAVADFRPAKPIRGKIKRKSLTVRFVPTPDILRELGGKKGGRVLVGFALEVTNKKANALEKLRRKNVDAIVLNDPRSFGGDRIEAMLLQADGGVVRFGRVTKRRLAAELVRWIERQRVVR